MAEKTDSAHTVGFASVFERRDSLVGFASVVDSVGSVGVVDFVDTDSVDSVGYVGSVVETARSSCGAVPRSDCSLATECLGWAALVAQLALAPGPVEDFFLALRHWFLYQDQTCSHPSSPCVP